ncbi:MAG TPA: VWA domain-containing protein [Mycobacteriales bacterium]|nr:VWA domain-containing protein [Mycobacteriales bacterium]
MGFEWPLALLSLLVVPALVGGYVWQLRRRRTRAAPYSSVALIRAAAPRRSAWRRHVPVALIASALLLLALASARPRLRTDVPVSGASLILALDVSGSMCATDVDPNRLTAAQAAVREFVRSQQSGTRIGLVVFSGFAQLAVAPTDDHDDLLEAIDALTTGRGTSIGTAILKSVDAIAEINPNVAPSDPGADAEPDGSRPAPPARPRSGTASPPPGGYAPEIVVLLTDGANTRGVDPSDAARIAADRGVRVYPIGFGTLNPTSMVCTAEQLGGRGFGGFGGGFGGGGGGGVRRNFLIADVPALQEVAALTGGTYFGASDADELQSVLKNLPRQVETQQRYLEVSVAFVALATLLVLLSVWAAARWTAFPA